MLRYSNFVEATSGTSSPERSVAVSTFGRDVGAALEAAGPASPELLLLAVRAVVCLDIALRDAAGAPDDGRWRTAYKALDDFVSGCPRRLHGGGAASFARLSNFLEENADLRQSLVSGRTRGDAGSTPEAARTA